jgi:hypothetical protein
MGHHAMTQPVRWEPHDRWTAKDDDDLRLFYGRYRTPLVAHALGRTVEAVWARAKVLGLRSNMRSKYDLHPNRDSVRVDRQHSDAAGSRVGEDGDLSQEVKILHFLERQISMRKTAYPKLVSANKISQERADREISLIETIRDDYIKSRAK